MHADIGNSEDETCINRFRSALVAVGAEFVSEHHSSLGVTVREYRVGKELVRVFADYWSLDIEGSEATVNQLVNAFQAAVD